MTKKYNYTKKADGITNDTGRPRIFKSPEEMQKAIDIYFTKNKNKPTVHGLCLALDFADRSSLLDYKNYNPKEYFHILSRAKQRIADRYEKGLWNKQQARGCSFALNAMFGCSERSESKVEVSGLSITDLAAVISAKRGKGE